MIVLDAGTTVFFWRKRRAGCANPRVCDYLKSLCFMKPFPLVTSTCQNASCCRVKICWLTPILPSRQKQVRPPTRRALRSCSSRRTID